LATDTTVTQYTVNIRAHSAKNWFESRSLLDIQVWLSTSLLDTQKGST